MEMALGCGIVLEASEMFQTASKVASKVGVNLDKACEEVFCKRTLNASEVRPWIEEVEKEKGHG